MKLRHVVGGALGLVTVSAEYICSQHNTLLGSTEADCPKSECYWCKSPEIPGLDIGYVSGIQYCMSLSEAESNCCTTDTGSTDLEDGWYCPNYAQDNQPDRISGDTPNYQLDTDEIAVAPWMPQVDPNAPGYNTMDHAMCMSKMGLSVTMSSSNTAAENYFRSIFDPISAMGMTNTPEQCLAAGDRCGSCTINFHVEGSDSGITYEADFAFQICSYVPQYLGCNAYRDLMNAGLNANIGFGGDFLDMGDDYTVTYSGTCDPWRCNADGNSGYAEELGVVYKLPLKENFVCANKQAWTATAKTSLAQELNWAAEYLDIVVNGCTASQPDRRLLSTFSADVTILPGGGQGDATPSEAAATLGDKVGAGSISPDIDASLDFTAKDSIEVQFETSSFQAVEGKVQQDIDKAKEAEAAAPSSATLFTSSLASIVAVVGVFILP